MLSSQCLSRRPIKFLPPLLVDQIKAGEVIGAPSNVLKELLENSLDAGAKNIIVNIEGAGLASISVEDDGVGIEFNELPLAFGRHATSKLNKLQDLVHLSSYGFRGEALASIASISKVSCHSIPQDQAQSGQIILEGGKIQKHLPSASKVNSGTLIRVESLFYNTPVRLKFLKNETQESRELWKIFCAYVLAAPHVSFSWKSDNNDKLRLKSYPDPIKTITERREKIFGKPLIPEHESWNDINFEYDGCKIVGFIGTPKSFRNTKNQFLLINGRYINDKLLHHLIKQTIKKKYESVPVPYFISLTLPSEFLDINVHPEKTTLKFERPGLVNALLYGALDTIRLPNQEFLQPKPHSSHPDILHSNYLLSSDVSFQASRSKLETPFLPESPNQISSLEIISADDKCILFRDSHLKIFHLPTWLEARLFELYEKPDLIESDALPLMISQPFSASTKVDEHLKFFQKIGMEFDRLDSRTLALRTWPTILEVLDFRKWINISLGILEGKENISSREFIKILASSSHTQFIINFPKIRTSSEIEDPSIYIVQPGDLQKIFLHASNLTA